MNLRLIVSFAMYLILLSNQIVKVNAFSPYGILRLSPTATDFQVQAQYKKMRSQFRRNRAKKHLIRRAYDQIMVSRKFSSNKNAQLLAPELQPTIPITQHIDQAYVYGYKLNDQYDDGGYFKYHFNETLHIMERTKNSQQNKKTAKILLFFGGLIMKILPCFIIFCLCRNRDRGGQMGLAEALGRARAGYANLGRRLRRP